MRKSETVVLRIARDGDLRWKLAGRKDQPKARLFDARDVRKHIPADPRPQPSPDSIARREARRNKTESTALKPAGEAKLTQALDTVSIVGNLVACHKAEMEMLVAQMGLSLETVVNLILTAQKAEADANRERLKAEREDARERWEIERQDRLERQKSRSMATKAANAPRAIVSSH
jgi:hypothetical protein